jgi:hypothetical protein
MLYGRYSERKLVLTQCETAPNAPISSIVIVGTGPQDITTPR